MWEAVDAGDLPATRYATYLELLEEIDPAAAPPIPDADPPGDEEPE